MRSPPSVTESPLTIHFPFSGLRFAKARNTILQIASDTSSSLHPSPTSAMDLPFRAFIEQLQRIATQLHEMIQGVCFACWRFIVLTWLLRRHPRQPIRNSRRIFQGNSACPHLLAVGCFPDSSSRPGSASSMYTLTSSNRLPTCLSNLILRNKKSFMPRTLKLARLCTQNLLFSASNEQLQWWHSILFVWSRYSNPEKDFRIKGIDVFMQHIGKPYQKIMCARVPRDQRRPFK